nr:hypothetical protein [Tanacetum cinerariifolium]
GGLDRTPDFQLARQHAAGQDHARQHQRQLAESALEHVQVALLLDQLGKVMDGLVELEVDARPFLFFAAVEGDRFGVFAQADQAEA